jgi:hypothetical protein
MFVLERLDAVDELDAPRIARAIEYTRFPYTASSNDNLIEEEGLLLRAVGLNRTLGYDTPADIVYKYPQFYWKNVAPAIRYLNVTSSGRQWIANLYSNVFRAEREMNLSGPQLWSCRSPEPWKPLNPAFVEAAGSAAKCANDSLGSISWLCRSPLTSGLPGKQIFSVSVGMSPNCQTRTNAPPVSAGQRRGCSNCSSSR